MFPMQENGEYYPDFLSYDCFHPARPAHQMFAMYLWDAMVRRPFRPTDRTTDQLTHIFFNISKRYYYADVMDDCTINSQLTPVGEKTYWEVADPNHTVITCPREVRRLQLYASGLIPNSTFCRERHIFTQT